MMRNLVGLLSCALLCCTCFGKPVEREAGNSRQPGDASAPGGPQGSAKPESAGSGDQPKPLKQVVLIYTGDTLSALQPVINTDDKGVTLRLGGLSALTSEIFSYEQQVTGMARQRAQQQGGNPDTVQTDAEKALLGDHPFLLLDYGGWERDGDKFGRPYVELQLRMFRDLKYAGVGMKLYHALDQGFWSSYTGLAYPQTMLNSAGPARQEAFLAKPLITRSIHGSLWGVASIPLPATPKLNAEQVMSGFVDAAAKAFDEGKVEFRILLCAGGPKSLYQKLKTDKRFNVVIGVSPAGLAEPQGFGRTSAAGPVMLPELNWGGQEFATCHLIFQSDEASPTDFNFERHVVQDDLTSPFPYRKQVSVAVAQRKADAQAARSPAKEPGAARIGDT